MLLSHGGFRLCIRYLFLCLYDVYLVDAVPVDNLIQKGLDVGRTTALKLGGEKGSNSLLQKRKKTVALPDFLDDSPSPKGPAKEVCASRASPLASPMFYSKGNSRQKVPGFGRSFSSNDHRQGDHDASHDEVVADARFSSSKSNFEAPKVADPFALPLSIHVRNVFALWSIQCDYTFI